MKHADNLITFGEQLKTFVVGGLGEEDPFTLPYSKLEANVSNLEWQSSYPQDNRIWIAPQIYAPPTFAAYRANRDPALEAILNYRNN